MLTEILLSVITLLLAVIAFFIRRHIVTIDSKFVNTNHRVDTVRKEHETDMVEIRNTFRALKCQEVSNQVNKLVGVVNTFVKETEKNMGRYDKEINVLFSHKDTLWKEIQDIRIKAGIESRDSETRAFKKNFVDIDCLLIEDEETVRKYMAENLMEKLGFDVTPVRNIAEALDALENKDYDCAIVDYYIGDQKGTDFIKECQKRNKLIKQNNGCRPTVKALIYTGKPNAEVPAGIPSLEKPFEWEDMIKMMECILTE